MRRIDDLPESLLHDIPIPKTKLRLSIASGYTKFIVNASDIDCVLEPGKIIAQFYKGKWVSDAEGELSQIPFDLKSCENKVHA